MWRSCFLSRSSGLSERHGPSLSKGRSQRFDELSAQCPHKLSAASAVKFDVLLT
jgi:hypothetical protein